MLQNHERSWSDQLDEIKATELKINLKYDVNPFKSLHYHAGPKTRGLEQSDIKKKLKAGDIDHTISELASPVLFSLKIKRPPPLLYRRQKPELHDYQSYLSFPAHG